MGFRDFVPARVRSSLRDARFLGFRGSLFLAWALLCLTLGGLPLAGAPGYESALVLGCVSSLWVPVATRFEPGLRGRAFSDAVLLGLGFGAAHGLVALLGSCAWGLVGGFCDGLEGIVFFVVAAGLGMVAAGALGGALRAFERARPRVRSLDWAIPVALFALFGLEFYATPAVYGFSPLGGVFLGPLYDTIYFPWARLLTYRLGTVAGLAAVVLLGRARDAGMRGGSREVRLWGRLGLLCAGIALLVAAWGADLGHRTTSSSLRRALGAKVEGNRCVVHYDRLGIGPARAKLLADECAVHVEQLEADLGLPRSDRPLTVYLFADDARKAELFGARSTNVAKPWRREVYVRNDSFPHPILRHELAHAVAADLGRGPFAVAGRFGGLVPDPGRIEGLAVHAAALRGPDAQDLLGWARAQRDAGHLPPLADVFGFGFYRSAAPNAYTAAGAFFAFLARRYGVDAVVEFYRNAENEKWAGRTLPELEREFQKALDDTEPDPSVRRYAEQRFSTKAVFERRCPQRVGRLVDALGTACDGSPEAVAESLTELRRLDAADYDARLLGLGCASGPEAPAWVSELRSELGRARDDLAPWQLASLLEIEALRAPPPERDRLLAEALESARNPRMIRELALLRGANGVDEETWKLVVGLLRGPRERTFFDAEVRFFAADVPPVLLYLRAKAALVAGAGERAFADLLPILGRLPHPELEVEARRSLALASCGMPSLGEPARAELRDRTSSPAEAARIAALLEFCEGALRVR